jgi:hypothetical protein
MNFFVSNNCKRYTAGIHFSFALEFNERYKTASFITKSLQYKETNGNIIPNFIKLNFMVLIINSDYSLKQR